MSNRMDKREASLMQLLEKRWSPRAYADKVIEPQKLVSLFEAARWAPSSYNAQPWSFVYAEKKNTAEFERILSCLADMNQTWARSAPIIAIACARTEFERNGKPNRHALYDVGQAVAHMTFQATAMELFIHQMAGFDVEKARAELKVPTGFEPVAALTIGYLGSPDQLPEQLKNIETMTRSRKSAYEFIFVGEWAKKPSL